ncbi:MAG TPA: protein kinase, partial [Vicinamibacterales bacterium]|nr:protein kinase [Vicinamibacterales bacterium]
MALSPGTRVGSYEVGAPIGAGGMGQVYRARDTKLQRDVAIKVLPDLVASDHDRRLRFEREAQLLASLNHPNIAQIYGLEEIQGGHVALAMELVQGETLSTLIARGTPPLHDALAIAKQIAGGLEAAHEKGIIHRDLKPANVMVTTDGRVKILDFGLGKALEPDASRDASNSPTITLGATQAGMILGTAAYMSPEQAKGRAADKRSDVWAFGCVLYELLTGTRAFAGDDVSETLASVLKEPVDLNRLPASTPRNVRVVVEKCLGRDRSARMADISTARFLLEDPAALGQDRSSPAVTAPGRSNLGATAALVALAVIVTAALTYWLAGGRSVASPDVATHVSVNFPEGESLSVSPESAMNFALSPDGRRVVFAGVSGGVSRLYDRGLDADSTRAIPGTEGASLPFFSPNGRSIGFFAQDKLKT